jgi:hypothetical protein
MTTRHRGVLGVAIGLGLLAAVSTARADNPCISDAKQTFTDCKADCKEAFQVAKDQCRNKDHECMEGCRAGRAECILNTSLDEDLTACRDTLRAAKQACRDDPENDTEAELDACIDAAQVTAFLCRKTARRNAQPFIAACRTGFRACAQACPENPDAGENVDKVQCKIDAKNGYLACKAGCREAFQEQKDLCLNRDHACVEGCRAGRDACRQPVEDQLDAAIASCNATKDAAVQDCKNTYPEGSQEREDCIIDALVVAFQCRDQAREDAKPQFEACRAGFKACAEACPPAS